MLCTPMLFPLHSRAQYAPPAGHPGTTAMYKDSTVFTGWASGCTVIRGWQDISDTSLGVTTVGENSMITGSAGTDGVVSLGDGGSATLTFDWPITNGPGWDFAVFENSFDDFFLELAFVEVSSDGEHFYRFPAHSLTDTSSQTTTFDSTDATKINNLAGKYRGFYGTPFDLEEMKGIAGLDLLNITHVRITDVVGCLADPYATRDTAGNKINDPWPTPFASGGFDLDAVGVIWNQANSVPSVAEAGNLEIWPNPASDHVFIRAPFSLQGGLLNICDLNGKILYTETITEAKDQVYLNTSRWPKGLYILQILDLQVPLHAKLIHH